MSDSLGPHGLYPTKLLSPWDFPGNSTGVDFHFPSPGDLPDPGIEPGFPALQADSLPTELQGKLIVLYGTINLAGDEGGEWGDSDLRQ